MHIQWQIKKGNPYAYLRESYWDKEKKAPRTRAVYLGSNLTEARRKLNNILTSGHMVLSPEQRLKLLQDLQKKAPEQAKEPKRDIPLESTIKLLTKQVEKYHNRPDIVKPLEIALKTLQQAKNKEQVQETLGRV